MQPTDERAPEAREPFWCSCSYTPATGVLRNPGCEVHGDGVGRSEAREALRELIGRMDDAWHCRGEYAPGAAGSVYDDVEILRALCGEAVIALQDYAALLSPAEGCPRCGWDLIATRATTGERHCRRCGYADAPAEGSADAGLREAALECAADLEAELRDRYGMNEGDPHPAMVSRFLRDIDVVIRVRRLATEEGGC